MALFAALREWLKMRSLAAPQVSPRFGFQPQLEGLEERWVPSTTTVTAGSAASLMADVANATAGSTILVPPGTYNLTQPLNISTNNLSLLAQSTGCGSSPTVINAPTSIAATGAMINITGTQVKLEGFVIDADNLKMDAAVRVIGKGSATIYNNTIEKTYNGGANQLGYSIRIGDNGDVLGSLTPGTALIEDNTLETYNKGGVIVDGAGSAATIECNTVIGAGLTAAIDQNGLQISNGATGRIQSNTVTKNEFNDPTGDITALGVEIYNTNTNTVVALNELDDNGAGVQVLQCPGSCTQVLVANNNVQYSTYEGIILTNSNNVKVTNNFVNANGWDGISLTDSNNNFIDNNVSWGSTTYGGIYMYASNNNEMTGNDLEYNADNGIQIQYSNNNVMNCNVTANNAVNGIEIDTGTGNTIIFDAAITNCLDGIQLNDTVNTTIEADLIAVNGRYGISLFGATGTTIEFNVIAANEAGAIYIDNQSSATMIQANLIFGSITHEAVGASATTATVQSSLADADAATAGLQP